MRIFHLITGILFYLVSILVQCDGRRCFHCTGVQYPRDCQNVTTCRHGQTCYTRQIVIAGGNVAFNLGCLSKRKCHHLPSPLIGKRSGGIVDNHSTDIVTCTECCLDDFCNKKGCRTAGTFTFISKCIVTSMVIHSTYFPECFQMCMLYRPITPSVQIEHSYKGQCETKVVCDIMTTRFSSHQCDPVCCATDFCNDRCGTSPNATITSPLHHSTEYVTKRPETSTSELTTSVAPSTNLTIGGSTSSSCIGKSIMIQNTHAHMCVHIVTRPGLSWNDSRQYCKTHFGGDLEVLDTLNKALSLRTFLQSHKNDYRHVYWIGARDFDNNNLFTWITQEALVKSETDWAHHQPVATSHADCFGMPPSEDYKWHTFGCFEIRHFICEQK
ncbi:uncharacterized protein LOC132720184 [Ruditapes philippinarum]|uniref:uncharacterized protein LOC132720184 n=1 Tax=Ruditapes philippinarum TaxID=129788 RepID=UPI00295AFC4A|nr:uncharacterized protein LOC132720184 [Ruditapes philippinarum]